MIEMKQLLPILHNMVGTKINFSSRAYIVVEIIDDIPALVLQGDMSATSIQSDAYGRARGQSKDILLIHVFNSDGTDFHQDFTTISLL